VRKKFLIVPLVACAIAALPLISTVAVSAQGEPRPNQFWWPEQLDLSPLRQHAAESNPLGENFDCLLSVFFSVRGCRVHQLALTSLPSI
jgi:hypothetical protein